MSEATVPAATGVGTVRTQITGAVATIVLDRPAKRNALTPEMLDELEAAVAFIRSSDSQVALIRGAGDKAFCVGADIGRFAGLGPLPMWREWTAHGHRVFDAVAHLPQPTIAAVHGDALGGGFELALACDFRVVTATARLGLPEVGLGTVPGWGGTERLTDLVGRARAKELILCRRTLDGSTACTWGLATSVAHGDGLEAKVSGLITELTASAPVAVQLAKQLIDASADGAPSRVLEPLAGGLAATTHDLREGVAAFHERRDPGFSGC